MDPVHRQGDVIEDCSGIFPEVSEMGKRGVSVVVTAQTLQGTPDARERGEEAQEAGVIRVALDRIAPVVGVEAEEEFDVLNTSEDVI